MTIKGDTIPETPTDSVIKYRQQGYDEEAIVRVLQQQGYSSQQIFDALNQADQKSQLVKPPQGIEQYAQTQQAYSQPSHSLQKEDIEMMVESLIEEKWKEFQKKIMPLQETVQKMDSRIVKIEQTMEVLKENFDRLHEGILGKISDYDTNLQDVGSSIKAMDQVFKKVLPSLTEGVNKLSKISK